ncbi:MAG: bifunctional 4-hydroxy-2-oxoglutarate aldolase/2-dehydro-3-deoxy-phosphogluconate aldolase [Planctomycetaceae bacterium]
MNDCHATSAPPFPDALLRRIQAGGFIATLVVENADHAVPLARALEAGGVTVLELTLRTDAAWECLRRIRAEVPGVLIGAGTVLQPAQVPRCLEAGAAFGVAPGMNPQVVAEAHRVGLPFAPGICTPSDIERALESGCRLMKFFPGEACGGLRFLRSIAAPYLHLGVQFLPLGGIGPDNAGQYLADPLVPAVGGSWLAPEAVLRRGDWPAVTALARQATEIVATARRVPT